MRTRRPGPISASAAASAAERRANNLKTAEPLPDMAAGAAPSFVPIAGKVQSVTGPRPTGGAIPPP